MLSEQLGRLGRRRPCGSVAIDEFSASLVEAGHKPGLAPEALEPASLGRLAQGAAGLAAWRREDGGAALSRSRLF